MRSADGRSPAALAAWLLGWNALARWTRYSVDGLGPLLSDRACLIVGYHGRPFAWDLCMLTARLHAELGYLPHGIMHGGFGHGPLQRFIDGLGFVTADGPELATAVARGEHIVVAPGGTREGCRRGELYRVSWGERVGYLRLALRYDLPLVPVAASGVDQLYLGLNDGDAWGKRLRLPARLPFWLGVGPLGLWPLSPPFPRPVRQRVGQPLDVRKLVATTAQLAGMSLSWQDAVDDPRARPILAAVHWRVQTEVQAILDDLQRQGSV